MRCHRFVPLAAPLALLALAGCDLRGPFLGDFEGQGIQVVVWEGGEVSEYRYTAVEELAAPEESGQLELVRPCSLFADVSTWTRFAVEQAFCSRQVQMDDGSTCTYNEYTDEGEGDLRGDLLVTQYEGRFSYSNCSNGTDWLDGAFTITEALDRTLPDPNDGYDAELKSAAPARIPAARRAR